MKLKEVTRLVAIFLGGVALSVFATGTFQLLLTSSGDIIKLNTTATNSAEWPEILNHLRQSGIVSTYLVVPLAGLLVGVFVGVLQKRWAMLVAASCWVPDFLFGFFSDEHKAWARSSRGITFYIVDHSLPFIVAVLASAICSRLISRRSTSTPSYRA